MDNMQFGAIIDSLFTIVPLVKKDIMKPEMDKEEHDLSNTHLHILFLLEDMGIQPMSEIGKHLQINKSNLTPLVQRLIDKQLVKRIYDEKDRRYVKITLTIEGARTLKRHKLRIIEQLKSKLSVLEPNELQELSESLITVKSIMLKLM